MKRSVSGDNGGGDLERRKKGKIEGDGDGSEKASTAAEDVLMDENLLYEVLKHVDARTLAWAACVSKQWNRTAQDERLWEVMCNKDGSRGHYQQQQQQFRAVVLALGGFRRLYSLHLWPLVKISSSPSPPPPPSSAWPRLPPAPSKSALSKKRLGKDEMNLSLSLFSIQYFAQMNFNNRSKGT
ncbi:PREDICTED: F-box protein GID2-like [Ipomoea nil]|uniref:F-box protein GID2-like n=1 Tax=Ipomoea nil TaxID=35883 RepID=UPI0009018EB1|nr:PREDICTED: F-box protein GID2-like [Ipomoea nil]